MLTLKQIEQNYPKNLQPFKKNLLREYLQYKILEIIFNSEFANKLAFLGGTALRIIYGNNRFSEDLYFDNFGLTKNNFAQLTNIVKDGLEKQGFEVETGNVFKGAFRCRIKLPKILFDSELSPMANEKLMIQIDTAPQNFPFALEKKILNKFDVFTSVFTVPLDLLLAQKIYAALSRKRAKGRDFYDIIFLLSLTKPNYKYLKEKMAISDSVALRKKLLQIASLFDFKKLAQDVKPFLFSPSDSKKIELFPEFIKQAKL
ncbi:nucleotidyl transferase AbiEii/AbiGii toxin family protein [Candidatus Parcubacteria bacterium]|nr:nucleotidyl transferase AbiEii/AbiGii toxin family protein [Candidatus Parcubacteria bacterium]